MKKNIPKILTTTFLLLIIIQTGFFIYFNLFNEPANAEALNLSAPDLQVTIPNLSLSDVVCDGETCEIKWIGQYIVAIYKYAVGIIGIVAAVVLMFGGILYITAGGSGEKITNAKSWIGASLTGLVLVLSSYMLLNILNPGLVNFEPLYIDLVDETSSDGCCLPNGLGGGNAYITTSDKCEGSFYVGYEAENGECTSADDGTTVTIGSDSDTCDDTNCSSACGVTGYLTGSCINNSCVCSCSLTLCNDYCEPNDGSCSGGDCLCDIPGVEPEECTSDFQCETVIICEASEAAICNTSTGSCYCDANECANASEGSSCTDGYCYSETCLTNDGAIGEVCGNEGGECTAGSIWCPSGYSMDYGGRDCVSGSICCM